MKTRKGNSCGCSFCFTKIMGKNNLYNDSFTIILGNRDRKEYRRKIGESDEIV